MIPLKLQLRNFMSYRDNVPPLLFEGFKVACLCGDNGHGKSALLDAVTWALWGKARAKSEDELIHHGRTEMEVEYEFLLGESHYRVLRKRALRKRGEGVAGVGSLDLQVHGEAGYRSIAGNTMHETQRRLNELLRMDYDTFVNSAFILQGKADAFTLKSPAERKQVLADLLGLAAYDALEDLAREKSKEAEAKRREEAARKATMENEVARRPQYEAEATAVEADLASLAERLGERDRLLGLLREQKRGLELDATRLQEVTRQLATAEKELVESARQVAAHSQRIAECEATLSQRAEVEAAYARLVELRARHEQLNARLGQLLALNEKRNELARAVEAARSRLAAELQVSRSAATDLEGRAAGAEKVGRELRAARAELAALADLDRQQEEKRSHLQSLRHQCDLLTATNVQIKQDGQLLKEKLDLMAHGGARCPVCESELGEHGRERLVAQFKGEREKLLRDYLDNEARVKQMEAESAAEQQNLAAILKSLEYRVGLERAAARLEKALADAEEAALQAKAKRAGEAALAERLEKRAYAQEQQAQLQEIEHQVGAVGYDQREHETVKAELGRLAPYEARRQQMDLAETSLAQERPLLAGAERLRERWQKQLAGERERRQELALRLEQLPALANDLRKMEAEVERLLAQQGEARLRQGRCQQMLNNCDYLAQQCRESAKAIAHLAEEKSLFDELAVAFGKKGIQAMIIEAAVPELEDEANSLLARMTDGRMRLKFETQRAAKSSDALIETLDIRIADELGTRSYELFSGGEAFKVNFAIRIALSKLLARRAGARLELLVVDEGFGTQDAQGRERLVEAINEVSRDFAKILVITHIEELKDAFPVRVDVVKTHEGSQFSVS